VRGWLSIPLILAGCSGLGPDAQKASKSEPPPVAYFKVDSASAGKITGKISFTGRKPARKLINVDDDDCKKTMKGQLFAEDVVITPGGAVANVLVHVKSGLEGKAFEPVKTPVVFDQNGCAFRPHVTAMRAGQPLEVTNSDKVTHNVHPLPRENREWNQGQPSGSPPIQREFVKPEIGIAVKCNVHSWMRAYIHVLDHPYFAVSSADGSFEIGNLPPGEYMVEAWHEKLGQQTAKATVAPSGSASADFLFKGE